MEWTREQRYRKYKDWDAQTLLNLQAQAATSPYQMHYHIHPLSGLINDPNGFSYYGSAMEHNGKLLLMYTGNHRDKDWTRIPYQVIAEMDKDNHITKPKDAAILPPDHVSEHFRDPQLFEHDGKYYVLLGAQD